MGLITLYFPPGLLNCSKAQNPLVVWSEHLTTCGWLVSAKSNRIGVGYKQYEWRGRLYPAKMKYEKTILAFSIIYKYASLPIEDCP